MCMYYFSCWEVHHQHKHTLTRIINDNLLNVCPVKLLFASIQNDIHIYSHTFSVSMYDTHAHWMCMMHIDASIFNIECQYSWLNHDLTIKWWLIIIMMCVSSSFLVEMTYFSWRWCWLGYPSHTFAAGYLWSEDVMHTCNSICSSIFVNWSVFHTIIHMQHAWCDAFTAQYLWYWWCRTHPMCVVTQYCV